MLENHFETFVFVVMMPPFSPFHSFLLAISFAASLCSPFPFSMLAAFFSGRKPFRCVLFYASMQFPYGGCVGVGGLSSFYFAGITSQSILGNS